jgi:hypothetical protein
VAGVVETDFASPIKRFIVDHLSGADAARDFLV